MKSEVSQQAHLLELVSELKHDILAQLQSPGLDSLPVTTRLLPRKSIHPVAVLQFGTNASSLRCFAKCSLPKYDGPQRLDTENFMLSQVAPKIWRANECTRAPRVVAFFPDQQLLVLEL